MPNRSLSLAVLMVLVLAFSGCMVTKSAYDQKEEEAVTLAKTVSDLDRKNKDLAARAEQLQAEGYEARAVLPVSCGQELSCSLPEEDREGVCVQPRGQDNG